MSVRVGLVVRGAVVALAASAAAAALALGLAGTAIAPAAIVAIAAAAGTAAALVLWRVIVGPLRPMLAALDDGLVSFAEGDYGIRINADRGDELGELARAFNHLGGVLRDAHDDVYQKELMLDTVLRAAPLAVVLVDDGGRVAFANDAARELFACERVITGERFAALLEALPPALRAALEAGDDELVRIERDTGEESFHVARRWFDLRMRRHALYLIKPLTRELVRQEAETWKKAIRVISHELNNSLAPISSLVHSARKIVDKPEHAHRLGAVFDTIEERARHLGSFLDGYAQLARLPRPNPREVAWRPFLEQLAALYPFRLLGDPPESLGRFDPEQLQQVAINLLKNAGESGSPADEVALEVVARGGGVALRVLDRGKGMSDDVLRSAARPFYSTKKTGSGLGLALCREIIDAHGGRLAIERRDGGGIVVDCWLPD